MWKFSFIAVALVFFIFFSYQNAPIATADTPAESPTSPQTSADCRAEGASCASSCTGENQEIIGVCSDTTTGRNRTPQKCCKTDLSTIPSTEPSVQDLACVSRGGTCQNTQCHESATQLGTCEARSGARGKKTQYCCKSNAAFTPADASFTYTPLEEIPGQGAPDDFVGYIQALYLFVLSAVGIAGLLMAIIGGFIYVSSAGNSSQVEKGKEYIKDALIGIVIAFSSWLILNVINPDLVNVPLSLDSLSAPDGSDADLSGGRGSGGGRAAPLNGPGNGSCDAVGSGACSITNLSNSCLGPNAEAFSRLCNKESLGGEGTPSGTDLCSNYGDISFSGGLFQINVFAHGDKLGDPRCNNLGDKGYCAPGKRRASDGVCLGWNCRLGPGKTADDLRYCMGLTYQAENNIKIACDLSTNGINTTPWACSANKCGVGGTTSNFCKK